MNKKTEEPSGEQSGEVTLATSPRPATLGYALDNFGQINDCVTFVSSNLPGRRSLLLEFLT